MESCAHKSLAQMDTLQRFSQELAALHAFLSLLVTLMPALKYQILALMDLSWSRKTAALSVNEESIVTSLTAPKLWSNVQPTSSLCMQMEIAALIANTSHHVMQTLPPTVLHAQLELPQSSLISLAAQFANQLTFVLLFHVLHQTALSSNKSRDQDNAAINAQLAEMQPTFFATHLTTVDASLASSLDQTAMSPFLPIKELASLLSSYSAERMPPPAMSQTLKLCEF